MQRKAVLAVIAFVLGLSGIASGGSTYTVIIPDTLEVKKPGWNEIDGGISASGALDNGAQLVISVSSDSGFKFVNQSDDTATVPYVFAGTGDSTTVYASVSSDNKTEWTFTTLQSRKATSQGAGIVIDDYSRMKEGTYREVVTFNAEIMIPLTPDTGWIYVQGGYPITGTGGAGTKVIIEDRATVTLRGVTINSFPNDDSHNWAGITCAGDATIILADGSTNIVKGGYGSYPGLYVPEGKTLTIKGGGTLVASSNGAGAGIGGGSGVACGNIVIEGGTIIASGGFNAASIGGGQNASCGSIDIRGGTIQATCEDSGAAGIGSGGGNGSSASCGDITISGGTITATGGPNSAGIGSGGWASCGNITISGGTIQQARGGNFAAGIGSGSNASCGSITIANTVTRVTATKGYDAPNSIGAGNGSTCGTVTIGGVEGAKSDSTYTYPEGSN